MKDILDVVVIGGGPAGMMAAGRAAERGKSVLLLEKNNSLGKKLLITGGGRCNVTNNKPETENLVSSYKGRPKALFSVFSRYGVEQTLQFFNSRGMETKVEAHDRVFPASDKAQSVWDVLVEYMNSTKVTIQTDSAVQKLSVDESKGLITIHTKDRQIITKSCIIATGGLSRPETGSTGDGYKWLSNLGHEIVDNSLALVPIATKETWVESISGMSLPDVKISVWQEGKPKEKKRGPVLFTHFGLSGPIILNLSSTIGELLENGEVTIQLDLQPDLEFTELKDKFHAILQKESNKQLKNSLGKLVTPGFVKILLQISKVNGDTPNHSVTKEDRRKLIHLLKGVPLTVKGLLGADKAVISAGGVKQEEVNFQTMESKIVPNLYIVGDLLNIDKPSGGYSLQLCWSTGYIAGDNC